MEDGDRVWRSAAAATDRFGAIAEAYDRFRPGYTTGLFDTLVERTGLGPGAVVVEVGAGTGIASVELARRCSTLVCVEPAPGMAAVARSKLAGFAEATVLESTFEAWEPTVSDVDLVCAANAWLWIDPALRWAKAASLLRPGGHLALLAHDVTGYEPEGFARRFAEVGGAINPALAATPEELGLDGQDIWAARIEASGFFGPVTTTRHPFSRVLDGTTFVAVLNTYGVNKHLDEATLHTLNEVLAALVDDEFGGAVVKHEDAVLHTAPMSP